MSLNVGTMNILKVLRLTDTDALLVGPSGNEVRLPIPEAPQGLQPGDSVEVFLFHDARQGLAATTRKPKAQVGEVAYLKIVSVKDAGAFLDWGLPKDLLLSWREVKFEQKAQVVEGRKILVALFRDEEGRAAASARLEDFLRDEAEGFQAGDKVDLLVADSTDLGQRVIVNHRYWGLIHQSDLFTALRRGDRREGYVKALRSDRKLNISLTPPGYAKVDGIAQAILDTLDRRGGFLPLTDKSEPEAIYALLGVSKKSFKQSLGALYKARKVILEDRGIRRA